MCACVLFIKIARRQICFNSPAGKIAQWRHTTCQKSLLVRISYVGDVCGLTMHRIILWYYNETAYYITCTCDQHDVYLHCKRGTVSLNWHHLRMAQLKGVEKCLFMIRVQSSGCPLYCTSIFSTYVIRDFCRCFSASNISFRFCRT
jgi:hypothetical protein